MQLASSVSDQALSQCLLPLPWVGIASSRLSRRGHLRNKQKRNAFCGWNLEILQLELSELESLDVDIDPTLIGFSTGEIDMVLSSADDPDDEVIRSLFPTPRTKLDDIWIVRDQRVG
jgi:hypothetical protein